MEGMPAHSFKWAVQHLLFPLQHLPKDSATNRYRDKHEQRKQFELRRGPSSAVAMIPRLDWWDHTNPYPEGPERTFMRYTQSPDAEYCPYSGYEMVSVWIGAYQNQGQAPNLTIPSHGGVTRHLASTFNNTKSAGWTITSTVGYKEAWDLGAFWQYFVGQNRSLAQASRPRIVPTFLDASQIRKPPCVFSEPGHGQESIPWRISTAFGLYLTEALARVQSTFLNGTVLCHTNTTGQENVYILGNINANDPRWWPQDMSFTDFAHEQGWAEIKFTVSRYGYGWGFRGLPIKLAAVVLGLQALLGLTHIGFITIGGWSAKSWSTMGEMLILAINSTKLLGQCKTLRPHAPCSSNAQPIYVCNPTGHFLGVIGKVLTPSKAGSSTGPIVDAVERKDFDRSSFNHENAFAINTLRHFEIIFREEHGSFKTFTNNAARMDSVAVEVVHNALHALRTSTHMLSSSHTTQQIELAFHLKATFDGFERFLFKPVDGAGSTICVAIGVLFSITVILKNKSHDLQVQIIIESGVEPVLQALFGLLSITYRSTGILAVLQEFSEWELNPCEFWRTSIDLG
ncbi:MAG: hypothetical protein Q9209_005772 [Squamulea sp. 1 TL-2023]